jgi:hypothetical protein
MITSFTYLIYTLWLLHSRTWLYTLWLLHSRTWYIHYDCFIHVPDIYIMMASFDYARTWYIHYDYFIHVPDYIHYDYFIHVPDIYIMITSFTYLIYTLWLLHSRTWYIHYDYFIHVPDIYIMITSFDYARTWYMHYDYFIWLCTYLIYTLWLLYFAAILFDQSNWCIILLYIVTFSTSYCLFLENKYTPRYSWNTAKIGVKHQSINESK